MGEILVRRAIDRSKYPKTMMYVDGEGNICRADKPQALSPEEKAARKEARDRDKKAFRDKKAGLRKAMFEAKARAKKSLNPVDVEEYEQAKEEYDNFRKG